MLCCLLAILVFSISNTGAHTLPISYLRLQSDADYLHLELIFNPFELTFISEVDDNHDSELNSPELTAHGDVVAKRVVAALKVSVAGKAVTAETAGMDPEMSGHHVRLRAHYKVDARSLPLTIESELNSITSSSHLIQATYTCGGQQRLAQMDAQSPKATFQPFSSATTRAGTKGVKLGGVTSGAVLWLGLLLLGAVATILLFLRRQPK